MQATIATNTHKENSPIMHLVGRIGPECYWCAVFSRDVEDCDTCECTLVVKCSNTDALCYTDDRYVAVCTCTDDVLWINNALKMCNIHNKPNA